MKIFLLFSLFSFSYSVFSATHSSSNQNSLPTNSSWNLKVDDCSQSRGILVLAHGKSGHDHIFQPSTSNLLPVFFQENFIFHENNEDEWENTILKMVGEASSQIPYPVEVAFGMWDQKNFQEGITLLAHQSVCEVVIIPLFISDHSDVIRAQKYQFHLSENNPLPFDPGRITIPTTIKKVLFKSALNDHLFLSQVIAERAKSISENPSIEDLILVAHGPNGDEDDVLWMNDLAIHAGRITDSFYKIHRVTLRDDAPEEIRNAKTKELQAIVKKSIEEKRRPLILPVLLAPGGIEEGLKERLLGLDYTISPKMLAPDPHLIEWIVQASLTP